MKPPKDVVQTDYAVRTDYEDGGYFIQMFHNPERNWPPCRVYWGSHGCARPQGHEGDHWCDCCDCEDHPEPGCVAGPPYYGPDTHFYGEDAESKDEGVPKDPPAPEALTPTEDEE